MSKITTGEQLAAHCINLAKRYKTLYVMGCFGAPMNEKNKARYVKNHSFNRQWERTEAINKADADTFGFDCVCMIKGLLWGWDGDVTKTYGGATYRSNDVPDINADSMIKKCKDVSTDFTDIEVGEVVWIKGHIGVYVGDGLVVECTSKWDDKVQITALHNVGTKSGYKGRVWTKHGKLPYVTYPDKKPAAKPAATKTDNAAIIWEYLVGKGLSECGAAGLMGNLYAESGLKPTNLQNSYEQRLGMTDEEYTRAVDSGGYTKFAKDKAGYGLAQWTHSTRKEGLYDFAKVGKTSIGDLNMQLGYLWQELSEDYKTVLKVLTTTNDIREASDIVLTKFERPSNQSESVQIKRAKYAQGYYDKYAGRAAVEYDVRVTASVLNIRSGPGTNYKIVGKIQHKGTQTIIDESAGPGANLWGKLKNGAGWISLDYTKKV